MYDYYYVYILTNKKHGVLYTGLTSDLNKRIYEHKNKLVESFTEKYNLDKLVYYEVFEDKDEALKKEKQIKKWKRVFKIENIEMMNPNWGDLYDTLEV